MSSTETKNFMTSKEIVDIIKACSKAGVKSFRLDSLQIQFDEPTEIVSSPKKTRSRSRVTGDEDQTNNSQQLEFEESQEIQEIHEEFQRGQMSLIDPLAFEEAQLEGEEYEAGRA